MYANQVGPIICCPSLSLTWEGSEERGPERVIGVKDHVICCVIELHRED
jgi:hypothetical protein